MPCYHPRRLGTLIALCGFWIGLLLAAPAWAQTVPADYQILLDTDNNPATGCAVTTVNGDFTGVDQRLVTTVAIGTTAATVSGVQVQNCVSGTFGAAVWSDTRGWPVGIGNGRNGATVIETYLPLAQVNGPGPLRLGVISAHDALLTGTGQSGGATIDLSLSAGPGAPAGPATISADPAAVDRSAGRGVALRATVSGVGEVAGAGGRYGGRRAGLGGHRPRWANYRLDRYAVAGH